MEELIYLRQICFVHSKVQCLDGLDALLGNKKKAIDSCTDDFQARITYGVEGIYIHSDESSVKLTSLYDYGVYMGERNINLYTGNQTKKNVSDTEDIIILKTKRMSCGKKISTSCSISCLSASENDTITAQSLLEEAQNALCVR